ncbi:peptide ABC transporter [Rhodococcus sp. 14-2483-1-1]|uniref:ABC transporter permease n=1 Tax=Rhodococcus sp. 14-2483-1-1 TaxID=2023148 RepID=UPI000B9A3B4A|nr:ABC transporter permease [Rhodococcus sp. 14-2483-1-1]OZF33015.1 peptide ABC transporter [Rhodococcus sp. 14-2483-1-1]
MVALVPKKIESGTRSTRRPTRRSVSVGTVVLFVPLAVILLITLIGPWIVPFDPTKVVGAPSLSPDSEFLLGTDSNGLDVFSRTIAGARIDVTIALAVTVAATVAGILIGLTIGMNEAGRGLGGFLARGAARFLDLLEAVPTVIVALVVVSFFGTSSITMIFTLSIILAPIQARLVRTEVLRVRGDAYLDAARQAGLSETQLVFRHVLPNSSVPALQNASVVFGMTIILTAALGFLGVGLPPPTPEWGSMITRGAGDAAIGKLWSAGAPAFALCLTVASVAIVGRRLTKGTRRSH